MIHELLDMSLGLNRMVLYAGYVLLTGTLSFWSLVWPEGRGDRRLVGLASLGTGLLVVATVLGPLLRVGLGSGHLVDTLTPLGRAATLLRLAVLAGIAIVLRDLVRSAVTGWRRVVALSSVVLIAATLVAQSNAIGGPWQTVKVVATAGHLLATAAWLGGLIALGAVLIPREHLQELDRLIPRFSVLATVSVITLVVTGAVHALSVAGGLHRLLDSSYGLVLSLKVTVFAGMLLLGNQGRKYAARVAFRRRHGPGNLAQSSGVHSLAVVMGAELAIAFVILSTTAILVMVAPHP